VTDQGFGVVRPLPGNGLVAFVGGLLLVCDAAEETATDLIEALRETADSGGDGRALARRAAQTLARAMTGDPATCAVAGPVDGGVAVLVSGAATATVVSGDGETLLSGSESLTWADRLITGHVQRVELSLPGAGRPHPAVRLDGGIVGGAGIAADLTDAPAAFPAPAAARLPEPPAAEPARPFTAELPHTAVHIEPDFVQPPPEPQPAPVQPAPYPMAATEPPAVEQPFEVPAPAFDPAGAAFDAPAPTFDTPPPVFDPPPALYESPVFDSPAFDSPVFDSPVFEPPQQASPQGSDMWGPPPFDPAPGPPSGPMAAVPHDPQANGGAAEPPFDGGDGDQRPLVYGVDCKNDHFNDPRVPYCAVCGIALVQRTLVPYKGLRPPLGMLVLDDGMTLHLEADYLLGRDPERAPEVAGGTARPAKVTSPDGSVSRRHLRVALEGWDVNLVDLGSVNGTQIQPPGDPNFYDIPPNEPVTITPGTTVRVGVSRTMRYESHRG
jgi:hypothetical protein